MISLTPKQREAVRQAIGLRLAYLNALPDNGTNLTQEQEEQARELRLALKRI